MSVSISVCVPRRLALLQPRVLGLVCRFAASSSTPRPHFAQRRRRDVDADFEQSSGASPPGKPLSAIAAKHGAQLRRPSLGRTSPADAPSGGVAAEAPPRPPRRVLAPPRARAAAGDTPAAKGPTVEESARLADTVRSCTCVADLLSTFMNNRHKFDVVTGGLVLARVAAVQDPDGRDDAMLRREMAFLALLKDLLQHVGASSRPPSSSAPVTSTRARVLSSLLHACGKLKDAVPPPAVAGPETKPTATAMMLLAEAVLGELSPSVHSVPSRPLAMAVWGAYRLGVRDKGFYDAVWASATTGQASREDAWAPPRQGREGRQQGVRRGGGVPPAFPCPFDPTDLAMLAASFSNGHADWRVYEGTLSTWVLDALPHTPHKALASITATYASAVSAGEASLAALGKDVSHSAASARAGVERRRLTLFACSEELAVRVSVAQGQADRAAGIVDMQEREGGGAVLTPERSSFLPPAVVVTLLRPLVMADMQPHSVLKAACRWMVTASVAGGEGGRGVPLISTLHGEALSTLAFALARARHEDPSTPALWFLLRARAGVVLEGYASADKPHGGVKGGHLCTLAWAFSMCSVPASPFVGGVLRLAASRPPSFAVPALCSLLFAGAVQGTLTPQTMGPILEHILDVAGEKAGAARAGALSPFDPDRLACQLLSPAPTLSGVTRLQGQIRTALLALQEEGTAAHAAAPQTGGGDVSRHATPPPPPFSTAGEVAALVPPALLPAWSAALSTIDRTTSKLQADVARVLGSVKLPITSEYTAPEGLSADAFISPGDWRATLTSNGVAPSAVDALLTAHPRGIAVEVDGPSHYTRAVLGFNAVTGVRRGQPPSGGVCPPPVLPRTGPLTDVSLVDLEAAVEASGRGRGKLTPVSGAPDAPGVGGVDPLRGYSFDQLSSLARMLTPTLRTQAKAAWLSGLGYKVVTVSFCDWQAALATQEKAELLAERGVPVNARYL